jgi:beta-glucanase (GH16 family)
MYGQQCYSLVWSDEFDGSGAPVAANWTCETGASGWGNNEVQNYTNLLDNARVENGNLIIEAKKVNNQWTSARLVTAGKQTFTYGRIEFRAKLPQGSGTWPALWMLGADIGTNPWPACGEIDIMEHVGKDPGFAHSALHTTSSFGNTVNKGIKQVQNLFGEFHIFRTDWTADSIKFYVDGNLFYTYAPATKNDQNWPFKKPFFLIMNVAMGGNWGSDPQYETGGLKNGIDPALTSVKMEIDYVRVYQISSSPAINGPTIMDAAQSGLYSVPVTDALSYNWQVPADAEILSGQNSSQINVKWGNTSGDVNLSLTTACQTFVVNPYPVICRITPDTSEYHFPVINENNQIIWEVATSPGNFLSLSQNSNLGIFYQISQPTQNPKLIYPLQNIYNFSRYKYLIVKLRNEKNNPPSIVRVDLVDNNGNVNLDKVFKITSFSNNELFNTYASGIEANTSFDLSNITELNLYINYGIFGKADTGNIYINDIFLAEDFSLSAPKFDTNSITIYPNPAKTAFTFKGITEPYVNVKISDIQGKLLFETTYHSEPIYIEHLKKGIYFISVTNRYNVKYVFKLIKE